MKTKNDCDYMLAVSDFIGELHSLAYNVKDFDSIEEINEIHLTFKEELEAVFIILREAWKKTRVEKND